MKKFLCILSVILLCALMLGCNIHTTFQIVATTAPVYEFTMRICNGTGITVGCMITETVSCLHDYTLQTSQMRMLENAQTIVISGAGLEDFLAEQFYASEIIVDASASIDLICNNPDNDHKDEDHDHHHEHDPHIWLSPANARIMATNICNDLQSQYPAHAEQFNGNLQNLLSELDALELYGNQQLASLKNRKLVTFHDGFGYMADAFNLEILHAIEEESGSEASAAELIEICKTITSNSIPSVFTERNGSISAADIISAETGAGIFQLDMAMSGDGYFHAMYSNIDTLKEALG